MPARAQISIEYLILTGFILLIVVVPSVIFLSSMANTSVAGTLTNQRVSDLGNGLTEGAKQLYFLGLYSKKIVEYDVPDNVESIFILDMLKEGKNYYYVGIVLYNEKDRIKTFFPSSVPLMSKPDPLTDPNAAYVRNDDLSSYITECAPPAICNFYNFIKPVTLPGKKKFKIETQYEGGAAGNAVKVNIVPIILS